MENSIAGYNDQETQSLADQISMKVLLNYKGKDEINQILESEDNSEASQTSVRQFLEFREDEVGNPLRIYNYFFKIATIDQVIEVVHIARWNLISLMNKKITPYKYFLSEEFFYLILDILKSATTPELRIFIASFLESGFNEVEKNVVKFDNDLLISLFQQLTNVPESGGAILTLEQLSTNFSEDTDESIIQLLSEYVNLQLQTLDPRKIWLALPLLMGAQFKLSIDFTEQIIEIIQSTIMPGNTGQLQSILHLIKYTNFPIILSEEDISSVISDPNNEFFSEYTQVINKRFRDIPARQLNHFLSILVDVVEDEHVDYKIKNDILVCLCLLDFDKIRMFPNIFKYIAQNLDENIVTGQAFVRGLSAIADSNFLTAYPDEINEICATLDSKNEILDNFANSDDEITSLCADMLLRLVECMFNPEGTN